jgi:hypothetical protein
MVHVRGFQVNVNDNKHDKLYVLLARTIARPIKLQSSHRMAQFSLATDEFYTTCIYFTDKF